MKIADSFVNMSSAREYQENSIKSSKGSFAKTESTDASLDFASGNFLDAYERFANGNIADSSKTEKTGALSGVRPGLLPSNEQNAMLKSIMDRMGRAGAFGNNAGAGTNFGIPVYSEYENTSFNAQGRAVTEDGRTIDFNLNIEMTRSYTEYMDVQLSPLKSAFMDPLIINVDAGVANISDQKFLFDLDYDGTEEEISMLGRGSGFLALDLNEDGIINDGRELFGTKSGDGFKDLAKYDSDGNGWIDENDEVFNRLKVWCKGDGGEDILMDLKEAGVGAIFLGAVDTQFDMDSAYGDTNGIIRSTGFFLREDGGTGSVQHVDLAAAPKGTQESLEAQRTVTQSYESTMTIYYNNNMTVNRAVTRSPEDSDNKTTIAQRRIDNRKAATQRMKEQIEKRRAESKHLMEEQIERAMARKEKLKEIYEDSRKKHEFYEEMASGL